MKKLFSILAVALFAISAHATVVTLPLDWQKTGDNATPANPFTVNGWASASNWNLWTTDVDEYDQLVVEVEDHTYDILVTVTCTDGSSDLSKSAIMRAGTNSVGVDLAASTLKGVEIKNYSEHNDVTITVNRLYLRGAIGPKKTETLWEGNRIFDDFEPTWGSEIVISHEGFEDIHAGDILQINYLRSGGYQQLSLQTDYNQYRPVFLGTLDEYNNYNICADANDTQINFAIVDATDIEKLKGDGGIHINAKHLTITSVKLIKHEVLWTGEQAVGNWNGGQSVAWSMLTDLKPGNILCVRVTAGEYVAEAYNQVFCSYKSDWSGVFSPSVNYLFQEGDEMPMIVEIPITHKMLNQLKGEQLNIGGKNFTMTDIFIKEGTPTNTVAAYLNVSSAGMATYVLPFNVPALPDGVEAYALTNNGDETIWANEVNALEADKPVLIVAAEGEYEFISEEGASDDISSKTGTYANGALIGTYTTIDPLAEQTNGTYNYVLNNGTDGVAFYQVMDASCSVAPYRAYLSCAHNANVGGANPAPKMRIVFHKDTTTGVENTESAKMDGSSKFLRNGQLIILRNGVEYNANGALIK